jgi:hypothetical protein
MLGVITKVALALPKSSPSVQLACLAVADWEGVLKVFQVRKYLILKRAYNFSYNSPFK